MNRPSGTVTAATAAKNSAIWSQPLTVMSELLRTQHRVNEIREQEQRNHEAGDRFERHGRPLTAAAGSPPRRGRRPRRTQQIRPGKLHQPSLSPCCRHCQDGTSPFTLAGGASVPREKFLKK